MIYLVKDNSELIDIIDSELIDIKNYKKEHPNLDIIPSTDYMNDQLFEND